MKDFDRKQLAEQIRLFLTNPSSPETIKYQLRREIAIKTQSLDCNNLTVIEDYLSQFQTANMTENSKKSVIITGIKWRLVVYI